jgi:phosphatidylglycerol:prolipoprotein diacylglycerol transferase
MIPYFYSDTIPFWPVPLRTWGLLVALGIAVALWYGRREARRRQQDPSAFTDFVAIMAVVGLVGARLGYFVFYDPSAFFQDPLSFFRLWEGGLSLIGTVVAVTLSLAWRRRDWSRLLPIIEVAALAYPLGEAIGRLGCFLIHDHLGIRSNSWIAVAFPSAARLDLGLLISVASLAIFLVFVRLNRQPRRAPFFLPLLVVSWGLTRFVLDFLRASDILGADARYLGLTPAQYGSLALIAAGTYVLARRGRRL